MAQYRDYRENEKVISAFLNNSTVAGIVRDGGIARKTVYRLKEDPDFQEVLRNRRGVILKAAVGVMQDNLVKNVKTLQAIIDDEGTAKQTRVNALHLYLSKYREFTTTVEIISRLERLENASLPNITQVKGVQDANYR